MMPKSVIAAIAVAGVAGTAYIVTGMGDDSSEKEMAKSVEQPTTVAKKEPVESTTLTPRELPKEEELKQVIATPKEPERKPQKAIVEKRVEPEKPKVAKQSVPSKVTPKPKKLQADVRKAEPRKVSKKVHAEKKAEYRPVRSDHGRHHFGRRSARLPDGTKIKFYSGERGHEDDHPYWFRRHKHVD